MVINGKSLLMESPIKSMLDKKETNGMVSHGLTEAGYDIRIKQSIIFHPKGFPGWADEPCVASKDVNSDGEQIGVLHQGRFILASTIEEFDMPNNLLGIVHDKSSWARQGLSVFNTCIEPGWKGYLTLELVFHGNETVHIPAGSGIAQVIFHDLANQAVYKGKYNHQADMPVPAINQ